MKKTLILFLYVILSVSVLACGLKEDKNGDVNGVKKLNQMSGSLLTDSSLIKWNGRTEVKNGAVCFYNTASGFEIRFYGTRLSAVLTTDNTVSRSTFTQLAVAIDDEDWCNAGTVELSRASEEIVLARNLIEGEHTVSVVKRSEPQDSGNSLRRVTTDGYFLSAPPDRAMKILCIGASGISGNGSLGAPGNARTTQNSSSLHSFGYLTARMFDADVEFVSNSGWGIKFGFNQSSDTLGKTNLSRAINYVGIDTKEKIIETEYDYRKFIPDFIIVNAGGNDYSAYINKAGDRKAQAVAEFQQAVKDFCTDLLTKYPKAVILWTHTKNSANGSSAKAAISQLENRLRNNIEIVEIKQVAQDGDPEGANAHASVITHAKSAEILAESICSVSGKSKMRENIIQIY